MVGRYIVAVRKARNITQTELAKRLGLDRTTVSKFERERADIDTERLFELANVLDCKVTELLGIEEGYEESHKEEIT